MKTAVKGCTPLEGVQVVVTRPEDAQGPLSSNLAERGARVLHWPVVSFVPPEDSAPLERALARLSTYDGIVFTSPRAVAVVCGRIGPPLGGPWVAAVGEVTAQALERMGWEASIVPAAARSSELVRVLALLARSGARVLFPASCLARDELPRGLRAQGVVVDQVTAYQTVANETFDAEACLAMIDDAAISAVTFASPSAVAALVEQLGHDVFSDLFESCLPVVIGPTTATALRDAGVHAAAIADSSTMDGLAVAVEQAVSSRRDP